MRSDDTILFKLDDPTQLDSMYTDDDDTCALAVDGWELAWYFPDDFDPAGDALDIWFSRKSGSAHVCLNVAEPCDGGFEFMGMECLQYWVMCD